MAKKCKWEYDDTHDCWETGCNNAFTLIEGSPENNNMKYCPYCGKEIWQLKVK